jgi:hypothetical protein
MKSPAPKAVLSFVTPPSEAEPASQSDNAVLGMVAAVTERPSR